MRLVLHAGAEFADAGAVQRDLAAWAEPLRERKVVVPAGESAAEWREVGLGLVRRKASTAAADLVARARAEGAEAVVVSADTLADALTAPEDVAGFVASAAESGLEPTVVVVVREQVGYINSLYCRRVLTLETARSFAEFAGLSVPAHRFDYVASFGAIADNDGVELRAVSYPDLVSKGAGRAVLEAAGFSSGTLAGLPGAASVPDALPDALPGPVVVGAARLLHKRMRRLGLFGEHGKARLRLALDALVRQADERGWDSSSYWGWEQGQRRQAEEEHGPQNAVFAEYVWGGAWPEPWSSGKPNRGDLADLEPVVLADVLQTVDRLLRPLARPPGAPAKGSGSRPKGPAARADV